MMYFKPFLVLYNRYLLLINLNLRVVHLILQHKIKLSQLASPFSKREVAKPPTVGLDGGFVF